MKKINTNMRTKSYFIIERGGQWKKTISTLHFY